MSALSIVQSEGKPSEHPSAGSGSPIGSPPAGKVRTAGNLLTVRMNADMRRYNAVVGRAAVRADDFAWNLPNAITLAGFFSTMMWVAGGSYWFAIAGILADELDGRIARATNQSSEFGSLFDWATDIALTGAVAVKLGGPFLYGLPVIVAVQTRLRQNEVKPTVGSARALMMGYGILTGA